MEKIINNLNTYANTLIDELIKVKDHHRDVLSKSEIDSINDICNLVQHNLEELKRT